MNAERLLALYEQVAEAPDAVPRLRRFVLDLAVRGKLLDAEIEWRFCTLGDVGRWGSGGTPTRTNPDYYGGDLPWLVIGDLNDGVVTKAETHITQAGLDNSSAKLIEPGTVLVAMYGSIGKLGIAGVHCATNQAIAHCVPDQSIVSTDFFVVLLRSLREDFLSKGQGVAQQNISQKILKGWPVQLPPLAEQRRIVAKVEELMALLDRLEAARAAREATRDRLTTASLARLTASDADLADFPDNARFGLASLPALTTRPDQIKSLRQTILNLAVSGKLVEQDAGDEPASELLKRIAVAKAAAKDRKGSRARRLCVTVESADVDIPRGWAPVRLDDVAVSMRYGTSIKCDYNETHAPVLRIPNVSGGQVVLDDIKYGPLSNADREALALEAGDLLMIRSNGSLDIVGRAAVVPIDAEGVAFAGYLVRLRTIKEAINSRYVWLALNSRAVRDQIERPIRSAVGLKNVNLTEFGNLSFCLPPLAEQHRIVAKVDALMALCDRLEAALTNADTTRTRLLEALLHEALDPATNAIMEAAE